MPAKKRPSIALDARKTPGQQRSQATVAAILEAAARILETEGLGAYSTNAVAARAGVSIGSLYQYFPSKDAVTRALIRRSAEALLADLRAVDVDAGLQQTLRAVNAVLDVAVRHQLQRPALARLLDLEEMRLPMDEECARAGREAMAIFARCLAATGLVPARELTVVGGDLMAIVKGLVDAAGQRGELDEAALALRARRAVFGYLQYAEPGPQAGRK